MGAMTTRFFAVTPPAVTGVNSLWLSESNAREPIVASFGVSQIELNLNLGAVSCQHPAVSLKLIFEHKRFHLNELSIGVKLILLIGGGRKASEFIGHGMTCSIILFDNPRL